MLSTPSRSKQATTTSEPFIFLPRRERTAAFLERVAWHEIKGAVIYRLEQAGEA